MSSNSSKFDAMLGAPPAAECGVLTASAVATALSATTTLWKGGIWIANGDATYGVYVGTSAVTAAAGTNRIYVGPGQCLPYTLSQKLSEIYIVAATGTPLVTYQASGA